MKMKSKVTTAILMSLFLVSIIAVSTHAKPTDTNRLLMIDIMAKGDDLDISGAATTTVIARIEYNKTGGAPLGQVEFHIKIYDDSGEKIYSMKGKLKNGMVIPDFSWYCDVRLVTWINLWVVMGDGMIKTTDIDLEIEYRGKTITLPNTGGKWVPMTIAMFVSPLGEYVGGVWPEGGWAYAGLYGMPGGVTYLTKYMTKSVPL
jgi:hypothetical protein